MAGSGTAKANGAKKKPAKAKGTKGTIEDWFRTLQKQAEGIVDDAAQSAQLAALTEQRLKDHPEQIRGLKAVRRQLRVMQDLVAQQGRGEAPEVDRHARLMATTAVLYLTSPLDIVPDYTPRDGFTDDAAVIGLAWSSARDALEAYAASRRRGLRRLLPWTR